MRLLEYGFPKVLEVIQVTVDLKGKNVILLQKKIIKTLFVLSEFEGARF